MKDLLNFTYLIFNELLKNIRILFIEIYRIRIEVKSRVI